MKIIYNGKDQDISEGLTLAELIRNLELNPDTVVAECDGAIVRREEYETYILPENGRLELIRFVGGG
jgi:thiamine biosynthesis protein ThiS